MLVANQPADAGGLAGAITPHSEFRTPHSKFSCHELARGYARGRAPFLTEPQDAPFASIAPDAHEKPRKAPRGRGPHDRNDPGLGQPVSRQNREVAADLVRADRRPPRDLGRNRPRAARGPAGAARWFIALDASARTSQP